MLSEALARDGCEQGREGDSLFVTFRSATEALAASVEAQRRLESEPWPDGVRLRVRMGLHLGEVADTRAGLVGLAIHEAARIAASAHGGQIVASAAIVTAAWPLPAEVRWRRLGVHNLRDVGPLLVFQVEHPDLQSGFPALRSKRAAVHNVPLPLTSLVGRDAESEAVLSLVDERRLVTVVGEGGCGKTRLALRVASSAVGRFVDGVWFVDLTPVAAGADMVSRVAEVIGLPDGLDELVSVFAEREVLVVLDNCEHVLASTTGVVATMLSECPTLRVLATSRAPLDVPGEALFRVPPLELPRRDASAGEAIGTDAVQLFVERARLVRPRFEVTEGNVNAVVDVCTRLEGLPLAIELAAARLRALSVEELGRDLSDRFAVLVGGPKSAPERHRTLRAAVEWSFEPLDPVERAVLFRLAPFHGGADLDSVRAVCDGDLVPSVGVLDILIRLVDKSLVTATEDDAATRYGMHETIRDYAAAAGSAVEGEAARERHARWFAWLATQVAAGPEPGAERAWIRRHNVERENLRAAIEWLVVRDPPAALRLCLDVARGGNLTAQWSWCEELIGRILPLVTRGWEAERAEALGVLASAALETDPSDAARLVADAVELLDSVDDPVARCWVLSVRGALPCRGFRRVSRPWRCVGRGGRR